MVNDTPLPDRASALRIIKKAKGVLVEIDELFSLVTSKEKAVKKAYGKSREENIAIYLQKLPLYALREVGASNVRTSALKQAGVRSIGDLLKRGPHKLERIHGVGEHSARTAHEAAVRIKRIAEKTLPVDLDDDIRPPSEEQLLRQLFAAHGTAAALMFVQNEAKEVREELGDLVKSGAPAGRWWQRPLLSKKKQQKVGVALQRTARYIYMMEQSGLREAIGAAHQEALDAVNFSGVSSGVLWQTYHEEPETYGTTLRRIIGFIPQDGEQLPLGKPPERGAGPRDGITTVYRIFDHANTLLYVGISNRVDARIEQHRKDKEWFWRVDRITTVNYPDRATALEVEKAAIISEKPIYNVIHNNRN